MNTAFVFSENESPQSAKIGTTKIIKLVPQKFLEQDERIKLQPSPSGNLADMASVKRNRGAELLRKVVVKVPGRTKVETPKENSKFTLSPMSGNSTGVSFEPSSNTPVSRRLKNNMYQIRKTKSKPVINLKIIVF